MKILNRKEITVIENYIKDLYGAEKALSDFVVLKTGKEDKLWIASRGIFELNLELLRINNIGVYFGRFDRDKLRMSVEGVGIIGPKAKKNIAEINKEGLWDFVRGFDVDPISLDQTKERSYVLVRYKNQWVGTAKLEDNKLCNFLPKSRKIISLSK